MSRLITLFVLGISGLLFAPPAASAQFVRPLGLPGGAPLTVPIVPPVRLVPTVRLVPPVPLVPLVPTVRPVSPVSIVSPVRLVPPVQLVPLVSPVNPVIPLPQSRFESFSMVSFGGFGVTSHQVSFGAAGWPFRPGQRVFLGAVPYVSNSLAPDSNTLLTESDLLAQAQHEASVRAITTASIHAPNPAPGVAVPAAGAPAAGVGRRLPATAEEIAAGNALNEVLKDIARAESKGASGPSAYIPPLLLKDMRFAGTPTADLLNFARNGLIIPTAFEAPALANARDDVASAFSAVAEPVRAGKAPDAERVAKLEAAFRELETTAAPVLKDLPAGGADQAKQFLTHLGGAIQALKGGSATGLIDPAWASEGLTGADLVKHMTKYKLQFGPAPRGGEGAYETMHDNLTAYLFVLTQPKKK